jgi:hypothetical protein
MSEWITVETRRKKRLPESLKPVLLDIGQHYPLRAMWVPKHSRANGGEEDFGEYDETHNMYFWPEGWYEWNQHETYWAVSEKPLAWCELPVRAQGDKP